MYLQTLKNIIVSKKLNQAQIAEGAGVSRAAVSKWFRGKSPLLNIETKTLFHLAQSFGFSPAELIETVPSLDEFNTLFLWDQLYPSMESFVAALRESRLPALARLVQVLGFHEASFVIGKKVLECFPHYKKFIKPKRRSELETLWPLYHS
ncbi:MAG: helix-turn-helix transcriptional regulator [Deltaproteobacteria bacterium]|nr:helix-turn-helix transcriptional regulator [Deltaproteobacteria bacterium]